MKGDATSQRRWEAYDKLGTFVIFVMSIVLGIQAMGLEGEWEKQTDFACQNEAIDTHAHNTHKHTQWALCWPSVVLVV